VPDVFVQTGEKEESTSSSSNSLREAVGWRAAIPEEVTSEGTAPNTVGIENQEKGGAGKCRKVG